MLSAIRASGCKRLLTRSQLRSSHVNAPLREVVRANHSNPQLSNEERERQLWVTPRQATVRAGSPAATPQGEVIKQLQYNFRMTETLWDKSFAKNPPLDSENDQALVILATPGYANWLEDTHFISEVLRTVTRHNGDSSVLSRARGRSSPSGSEGPPFEADVVCACVDGLSPGVNHLLGNSSKQTAPAIDEGLSFLQGRTQQIVPALWEPGTSDIKDSPGMLSSLTFSADGNASQVTLPLANTLFRNGRSSTLLISKWQYQQDGTFVRLRNEEKTNQLINALKRTKTGMPSHYIPVVPLTPARRIISGLGNIVRQIQYDEDIGPASRELEANIDDYQKSTGLPASTVNVWALVIPPELVSDCSVEAPNDLIIDPGSVKRSWASSSLGNMNTIIGSWIERGAKVCRVLSGGGGWGAKQGLLSLDPQTSYTTVNEARFDFSGGSLEGQQASVLGNIASPDALIQFFLAPDWKRASEVVLQSPYRKIDNVLQISTVVGAVPSTADSIPGPVIPYGQSQSQSHPVYFDIGHFGAVSESGMYYSSPAIKNTRSEKPKDLQRMTHTKIDVPYSYIFTEFREAEKKPSEKNPTWTRRERL